MAKNRLMKHIIEERSSLLDQAQMFATGDAHRIEARKGQMEDVGEERLNITLSQVQEIDSIINHPRGID